MKDIKNPAFVDLLKNEIAGMTPRERLRFRRELASGLPEFVREIAERARQAAPGAPNPGNPAQSGMQTGIQTARSDETDQGQA